MASLTDRVLAQDYTVTLDVRKAGAQVEPAIATLASNPDEGVRELALYCLAETGGPLALDAFARALVDRDVLVRAAAMRGLSRHAASVTAQVTAKLFFAYDNSEDPVVRQNIALVLGQSPAAGPGIAAELEERWQKEAAPDAQEGCVVALARLGDAAAQKEFVARLQGSSGRDRARFLEHGFYIQQAWLNKPLRPILDDPSPVLRIGVDGVKIMPEYLRACDLAVALIAAITGHAFSFPVDRQTNYDVAQLDEVRAFVDRLP